MPGKHVGSKPPSLWPLILAIVICYVAMLLLFVYTNPLGPH